MTQIIRLLVLGIVIVMILFACNILRPNPEPTPTANPLVGPITGVELSIQATNATEVFKTVGQVINYTYTVRNIGQTPLVPTNGIVTISDTKVTGIQCPNVNTIGNLDANLDPNPNESLTCPGTYAITQDDLNAGSVNNSATATVGTVVSGIANASVRMAENKVLTLIKNATPTTYSQVGQSIKYDYVITNTGEAAVGPIQFVVNDDRISTPINCGSPIQLAKGQTVSCSATYTITSNDLTVTQIVNSATASGGSATVAQPTTFTITNTNILTRGTTIQHPVSDGEWMLQIARCYGADFTAVRDANRQVIDPDLILPHTTLSVPNIGSNGTIYGPPCVEPYTVQAGDTWNSIAQKFNADLAVLQEANKGVTLSSGVKLKIPKNSAGWNGSSPSTPSIPPTTACNRAQLVSDVSIPDGSTVAAGSTFTKTWRLRNIGTCTWTTGYVLIFDHGERMEAPDTTPLTTGSVPPNGTVDVSVTLRAPATPGTYQADFRLRSSDNVSFGIGATGQNTFWVRIVVSQSTTAKIAFASQRDSNNEIYVMNADGTNQVRLTNNPSNDESPTWSPDRSRIAFRSERDGNNEIYVMNADGTGQFRLTNNNAADNSPVWSPNGGKIAFRSERDGNFEIYVMNADGTNQTRLTNNNAVDNLPTWSPDSSKIAFTSERDGNVEIYVMNADGNNQTRLTNNNVTDFFPAWSPNGSKIAFSSERDGNIEIYVMNADGNNQTRLTNNSFRDNVPAWSPDSNKIAFSSERDGNFEIYVMNADGNNQTRLTNNGAIDGLPAWSPDGSKIAFYSDRDGNIEIYVMNTDGNNQLRLTNNNAEDDELDWSP